MCPSYSKLFMLLLRIVIFICTVFKWINDHSNRALDMSVFFVPLCLCLPLSASAVSVCLCLSLSASVLLATALMYRVLLTFRSCVFNVGLQSVHWCVNACLHLFIHMSIYICLYIDVYAYVCVSSYIFLFAISHKSVCLFIPNVCLVIV